MAVPATTTRCYCNVLAMQKGLDPVGSAYSFDDAVVVETPLPWKHDIYQQAGALPQRAIDLLALWLKRYQEGLPYRHGLLMVAPDPQYSRHGFRRVMHYERPEGAFAQLRKTEYSVPEDRLGALVWTLFEAQDTLPQFAPFRAAACDSTRDLLVCTHGTVDAACARFGYPLYNDLRRNHARDDLRVWRVSHFGGHVFAPTMLDMPTGHHWAYVEAQQAEQIVQRSGDVRALYGHYRGWAGLDEGFLQAAERELWMRYGWEWFTYLKSGQFIARDASAGNPGWAEVQLDYTMPAASAPARYTARVAVRTHIHTAHSTASAAEYPYPQYTVTELR